MKRALLSCVALTAFGGAALVTDARAETAANDEAESNPDSITVYATRNPKPAFDYPGQVTVIGKDQIEDFNPSSIADIFDAAPGAKIGGGPRRAGQTPDIRGLSGEGVLVLFDGARQSFLSGHDGRFFIDPDLVQTIEVVRGPTSALYGSGALGGVIALRTVTAADFLNEGETAGVKIGGGFQSVNDEWRASATGAIRSADDKFDLIGNLTWRESGDIALGNGLDLQSDDNVLSSLLKATMRPSDDLTLSASWMRYGADSVDPNNPQGNSGVARGNDLVDRNINANTLQGTVNYAPADNNFIDLNLVGYYTRNTVEEDVIDSPRLISREVETFGISLDNRSKFALGESVDLTFTYGGEFYQDDQIGLDNTTDDGTRGGVPDATGKFYGLFAQAELSVDSPVGVFSLIPGVRWDKFENEAAGEDDTDDEAVSPKIGVSYKPVEEVIIFGNWSEAFRAPSFNELYADGIHFRIPNLSVPGPFGPFGPPAFVTNFFVANTDLTPEQSQTWEVGAGVNLDSVLMEGDAFSLKGSYFKSDVENLIDLQVALPFTCFLTPDRVLPFFPPCGSGEPFGNFSRNVNVTNAELDGVEIEAYYDSDVAYLRANLATIDGRDTDNDEFVGILAPTTAFIDAGVKWQAADLRLGGRLSIAGDFDKVNDPTNAREGYTVGDIYLVWQPTSGALEGLRLDLGVDNVGDADYNIVAAGVSQPGRNYKASISWRQGF